MQLITLPALALFATSALAADCLGGANSNLRKVRDAYWDARQKMCSNSDCAYQQVCTTQGFAKYVYESPKKDSPRFTEYALNVALSRKNTGGQKGFKDCWDATENIITQCVDGQDKLVGTWEYNGQLYQFDGQMTIKRW
ncbi:hypothetical protein FVEN_g128 [Fusarium venenatum]|uniref:Uncharacterized protein n=1 Tax=Fusarium venenatum TaxID=56646 RepID=A0A2L2TD39_9HYPO|nr:uncharacterized protein FVRRES_07777 [Fusarium venenatum]KAG8362161.1 hypothetical protein FVEN_g128 [Fusarium venenatum]CEI63341.1 unnamed protein product [Fusarium venenatum]